MVGHYISVNEKGDITGTLVTDSTPSDPALILVKFSQEKQFNLELQGDYAGQRVWLLRWEDNKIRPKTQAELDDGLPLEYWLSRYCAEIDSTLPQRLYAGFVHEGIRYQADAMAQANATGFLTALAAGLPVLPITWRTADNLMVQFLTGQEFGAFAAAMMISIQTVYQAIWTAKDRIRSAESKAVASVVLDGYLKNQ